LFAGKPGNQRDYHQSSHPLIAGTRSALISFYLAIPLPIVAPELPSRGGWWLVLS